MHEQPVFVQDSSGSILDRQGGQAAIADGPKDDTPAPAVPANLDLAGCSCTMHEK